MYFPFSNACNYRSSMGIKSSDYVTSEQRGQSTPSTQVVNRLVSFLNKEKPSLSHKPLMSRLDYIDGFRPPY